MKKILFTFILATLAVFAHAQKATQKTVSEVCSCVKKIDPKLSEDERTDQAVACVTVCMQNNVEALKKEYNIKNDNSDNAIQEIATKFSMVLVQDCHEILPYLINYGQRQQEQK